MPSHASTNLATMEMVESQITPNWQRKYARRLLISDTLIILWAVFGAQVLWFGADTAGLATRQFRDLAISYSIVSVVLSAAWLGTLLLVSSREYRILGAGAEEYKRVISASTRVFGAFAIIGFVFQIDFSRGYLIIALPVGLLALLVERWLWRQWLNAQRSSGGYSSRAVLVGSAQTASEIAQALIRSPAAGYQVVAACLTDAGGHDTLPRTAVPVAGDIDDLAETMLATGADTVIVVGGHGLSQDRIREISWSLAPGEQHLVMVPSLIDVAGPRIHSRPVAGLPLVHVETPRYEGARRVTKRAFDIISASAAVIVLSPLLLGVAIAVKLSTPGPVLFRQGRVGYDGRPFSMLKFRSMVDNAEDLLPTLLDQQRDAGNAVLFKMTDDPRITPIGRFIRRFSIDELPQLFNVIAGSMSMVGPRPSLPSEVALYDQHVHRRFLVRPGITGLWQVSGRSSLSWDDSVRLDLYYVENWSLTQDMVILWRTFKAVLQRDGAY